MTSSLKHRECAVQCVYVCLDWLIMEFTLKRLPTLLFAYLCPAWEENNLPLGGTVRTFIYLSNVSVGVRKYIFPPPVVDFWTF